MRLLAPSLVLAAALALGGCQGPVNRGVESANQPVVSRTDYVIDLGSDGPYGGLRGGEATRLGQWFDSLRLGYGDRVTVDDPSHGGGASAREAVAGLAARYGLLLAETAPVTEGAISPGNVRVIVSRSRAEVPDCPNWKRPADPEFAGSTMSNYGCATNGNLAMMVANPQDLVRGVDDNAGHSNRALIRAGDAYQKLVPTGVNGEVKKESAKGGGS